MRACFTPILLFTVFAASLPARADDALAPYNQAIADHPDDVKAYQAYGMAALSAGRFDDAIAKLKIGVARFPDFTDGYYMLAYAFRKKQQWADAADYYRRCVMLKYKADDSQYGLGYSLAGLGDKKGAAAAFKKYVADEKRPQMKKFVDDANAQIARLEPPAAPPPPPVATPAQLRAEADQLRAQQKFDEAAVAYRKAIAVDKNNLDLYNDLGNVYFSLKRYPDAAQAFRDAVTRDPSYALGWYNLGHALRKSDKKSDAVDAIRHYIKLRPDDPDPYYGLGQTLKAMGDLKAARDAFATYVTMEKRPAEQKWVEKAKQELAAIDAQLAPPVAPPPAAPAKEPNGGKVIDEKMHKDGDLVDPFNGETPVPPGLRDLHDPFQPHDSDGVLDPFQKTAAPAPLPRELPALPQVEARVRDYGRAITAYRRALAQHAEEVQTRYERGVMQALAGRTREALQAWNGIDLDDSRVAAARRQVLALRK